MTAPTLATPQAMALLWSEPTRAKLSLASRRLPCERCSSYAIGAMVWYGIRDEDGECETLTNVRLQVDAVFLHYCVHT
jgi:hypothetical protein